MVILLVSSERLPVRDKKNFALRNSAPQMRRVSDIFLCICVCLHSGAFFLFDRKFQRNFLSNKKRGSQVIPESSSPFLSVPPASAGGF